MPSSAGDRKRRSSALTGLTTKKKTAAAIATNWIRAVMNAPYRNTAPLIVNVRPLKSGFPKIIAMIGITRSFTSERDPHHERDRQLDDVPAQQEVPELLQHALHRASLRVDGRT